MRLFAILLVLFMSAQVISAQPFPHPPPPPWLPDTNTGAVKAEDVPPEKGSIRKNIYILFDQSGSITTNENIAALHQVVGIVSQSVDEFNLKICAFAADISILKPGGQMDVLKERQSWMAMPSGNNLNAIVNWLGRRHVRKTNTVVIPPLMEALSKTKDLTVIIIGDMLFQDIDSIEKNVDAMQKERKKILDIASIGFINVGDRDTDDAVTISELCKKKGWFMINTKPLENK